MNNWRALLPAMLLLVGCATASQAPGPRPRASGDIEEYRKHLEDAYAEIVAHESTPVNAPAADVEAAASIEIPEHRAIQGALAYFTTDLRDSIQTSLIRSARYKPLIDRALAERRLPKGLAYLPVIESAYLPTLTSRAGAHGIWQFMPETAREYGLRVDWWIDERADPERSTLAAAAYLDDLYRQFGDWPLALAAYNAGPGRIRRALNSTGARNFWELVDMAAVPKETRGYVPTFLATLVIAGDPDSFGFRLGVPEESDHSDVTIEGPVSLQYVAEVAGVEASTLRDLNPAYGRGIVPPGASRVRMPSKAAEKIGDRASSLKNDDADMAVCTFTLRKGDTVAALARAVGSDPSTIMAMNGRSPRPGESIYLPVRARELGGLLSHWNDRKYFYAVRKGDTMYSIARRHNLTVAELRDLNALDKKARLRPGQKLRVASPRVVTAGAM